MRRKTLYKPINEIKSIFKEDITSLEAKSILDTAKGDINIIKEKYVLAQNVAKIGSVVGWMLRAIMNDYQVLKVKLKLVPLMIMSKGNMMVKMVE